MPKILRQIKGISLIEIMLAVGVSSGVMLAVSSNLVTTQKSTQKVTLQNSWSQEIDIIRLAMNDPTTCSNIVQSWNLPTTSVASPPSYPNPIPSISTYLKNGETYNGIKTQSIYLKTVPNFTTNPVENGYSDLVYLEISGKRILSGTSTSSPTTDHDLFSGYNQDPATLAYKATNPINFLIIRDSSGKVIGCNGARMSCADLGGTFVNNSVGDHAGHGDPLCQLNTLRLNPGAFPGDTMSGSGQIQFGDPYVAGSNNNTTLGTLSPDSITDDIKARAMTLSAGTLNLNSNATAGNVGIGGPSGVTLSVHGSTNIDKALKVNSNYLITTSCITKDCGGVSPCSCPAGTGSMISGGVDCGTNYVFKSYLDTTSNTPAWIGSCSGGVSPQHITVYCCANTN